LAFSICCTTTWLLHARGLENFCFSKSMSSIVQVSENTILSLENTSVISNGFLIVRVQIKRVWSGKVTNLCYTQFTVAYLFIQEPWFGLMRMNICVSSNDIMMDTAPIVECLARNRTSCIERFHWVSATRFLSLTVFLLIVEFFILLSFILHSIIVWHPVVATLHIITILWFTHHQVIYFLLRSCVCWWFITYIISFVSW